MQNIDLNLIQEFERMIDEPNLLDRKVELVELTNVLNRRIDELDHMIEIYSTLDFIRVGELMSERISLNNQLLDVISESNDLYLESIRRNAKIA
jgi:regulator of sigma D